MQHFTQPVLIFPTSVYEWDSSSLLVCFCAWLANQVPCQMKHKEYKITTCPCSLNDIRSCSGHQGFIQDFELGGGGGNRMVAG